MPLAESKEKARRSLNGCDVVLTRDRLSYDYVCQNTEQRNVHELMDMAFYMPYCSEKKENRIVKVGIGVSLEPKLQKTPYKPKGF